MAAGQYCLYDWSNASAAAHLHQAVQSGFADHHGRYASDPVKELEGTSNTKRDVEMLAIREMGVSTNGGEGKNKGFAKVLLLQSAGIRSARHIVSFGRRDYYISSGPHESLCSAFHGRHGHASRRINQ